MPEAYANTLLVDEFNCNLGFCFCILLKVSMSKVLMLAPVTTIVQFPILILVGGFLGAPLRTLRSK